MRATANKLPPIGATELLLLVPGSCIGISNFAQHAAASGYGTLPHALAGFALFFAAFNLTAAAPLLARRLRAPDLAKRPLARLAGHGLIVATGAPLQFFVIACAIVFFRDPAFSVSSVAAVQARSLFECGPLWIGVYAFLVAIDTLAARNARLTPAPLENAPPRSPWRLSLHADGIDHLIEPSAISHVLAMGDYVQIHAGGRRLTVKKTMTEIESSLAEHGFLRVHRSALVRIAAIAAIKRQDSAAYEVELACGAVVPLSRRRLGEVRSAIAASN